MLKKYKNKRNIQNIAFKCRSFVLNTFLTVHAYSIETDLANFTRLRFLIRRIPAVRISQG